MTRISWATLGCLCLLCSCRLQTNGILRPTVDGQTPPQGVFKAQGVGCDSAVTSDCLNEEILDVDDFIHISGAISTVTDNWYFTNALTATETGTVDSVRVTVVTRKTGTAQALVAPTMRFGNNVTLTNPVPVDTIYSDYTAMFYRVPGGLSLTWSLLRTCEIGVEMLYESLDSTDGIRTAQIYAEVFD